MRPESILRPFMALAVDIVVVLLAGPRRQLPRWVPEGECLPGKGECLVGMSIPEVKNAFHRWLLVTPQVVKGEWNLSRVWRSPPSSVIHHHCNRQSASPSSDLTSHFTLHCLALPSQPASPPPPPPVLQSPCACALQHFLCCLPSISSPLSLFSNHGEGMRLKESWVWLRLSSYDFIKVNWTWYSSVKVNLPLVRNSLKPWRTFFMLEIYACWHLPNL